MLRPIERALSTMHVKRAQNLFLTVVAMTTLICIIMELYFQSNRGPKPVPAYAQMQRYITVNCRGRRLGNLMFNYASLLGIAKRNDKVPVLPSDLPIHLLFQTKMQHGYYDHQFGMYHTYEEFGKRACAYDMQTEHLEKFNILLEGYFQSWKYFVNVEDELREHFKVQPHLYKKAREQLKYLVPALNSKNNVTLIGVHARRQDMTEKYFMDFGYTVADAAYFLRGMAYFRKRYKNVIFLVCSDDIKWCKQHLLGDDVVFSEGNSYLVDFVMLTMSSHMLMSVGSFGWWASWLVNGTTVYYKEWPRSGSQLSYQLNKAEYFPPHWIAL